MKTLITITLVLLTYAVGAQNVVINEVLTQNKGLVKNGAGKSFDYVELYNKDSKAVNLSGYFLSDDKDTLKMYRIPAGTSIAAKEYLVFWANGDVSSKELNTNFKLKQSGETVYLSYPNGTICHKLKYKRQFKNISYGLLPDGSEKKDYLIPTPKAANKTGRMFASDRKGKAETSLTIKLNKNNYSVLIENPNLEKANIRILDNKTDKVLYKTKIETANANVHFAAYPAVKYVLEVGKDTYRILKK